MNRSDILIHWTGKDITVDLPPAEAQRHCVNLLTEILGGGLRYTPPRKSEQFAGGDGMVDMLQRPMICFTELKLSEVSAHASRYGSLGIGFSRKYLLEYGANPAFYVHSDSAGIANRNLVNCANRIIDIPGADVMLSYFKPMSDAHQPDLKYYDEMEWRMVLAFLGDHPAAGIVKRDESYYFAFSVRNVSLLVFPNEETRIAALRDEQFMKVLAEHTPMMVDADKCDRF